MILYLAGAICGSVTAFVFRRYADRSTMTAATRKIAAHWLEIRLYFDDPRLVWQAQKQLLRGHFQLLRACAVALLLSGALTAGALTLLDSRFGVPELQAGDIAVLTTNGQLPADVTVEAGPFHAEADQTASYRIRANRAMRLKDVELPRDHAWLWPFAITYTLITCVTFLLL